MSKDDKRRALGRGLDALLPAPSSQATKSYGAGGVFSCAIEKLVPQKGQPRQHFDPRALAELSQSIREHGLLEPIVVRKASGGGDTFEIIAGERRWRASQKAGLKEVLVVVKDVSPRAAFELALIENVQREDLNAVELAEAYDRLVREHGYSQEALATRLGKDRTTITNSLRLLKLPPRVRSKVISGDLSEGHARALLGAATSEKIEELAEKVLRGHLTVRATEALVRGSKKKQSKAAKETKGKSAAVRDLEARLSRSLGTKVYVRDEGNKGEVAIPYADLDMLDRIISKLSR
ncbi:MAG: ParB/RepB/Spo0J family partition protein [Myxococcales bacterium]|nr:ParB/RepB/Spo0J family partition protein [Myxococcales bacterium]